MENKNIIIHHNKSIVEGLNQLNNLRNISRLILFVVDSNGSVLGSITDGDIRRSIVKEQNLNKTVEEICNKDFKYIPKGQEHQSFDYFRKMDLKILPVLDENKKILDIIDLDKIYANLPLEAMIMAGGRGKRLSPLTDKVPKPMLPLGGKPIIEYNIDRLVSFGVKKIYISVKYLGEQIIDYFEDGKSKGIKIEYIWENEPLGTAGALALVEKFETENILLMNSDLFTNVNFESLYNKLLKSNADMVVASTEYKVDVPYAVFETNNNLVIDFKEKPSYIYHSNAGIYILRKNLINKIPKNEFYDITDLMESLVKSKGKLVYDPIIGYWIDIGKPVDYQQAQEFIKHINL